MYDPNVVQPSVYQDRYVTETPAENHSPDYDQWDPFSQTSESDTPSDSTKSLEGLQEGLGGSYPSDEELFSDLDTSDIPEEYWGEENQDPFGESEKDTLTRKLDKLSQDPLSNPYLKSSQVEEFQAQIEELKSQVSKQNGDLTQIGKDVEKLSEEIQHSKKTGELLEKFKDLPNNVTARGKYWEATQAFSLDVVQALETGNWGKVGQFLQSNITNGKEKQKAELGDKKHRSDSYRVVQQFVGTLFHRLADGNQEKLDAFLNLIPKGTRQTMIRSIDLANKDLYSRKHVKGEGEAASMGFYGTPIATADRIRQSLDWNEALYYDDTALSPPEVPTEI